MTFYNFRMATPADQHLPSFDNTKLTAINTCPTWGLIRYEHHKTVHSSSRAMALEAGDACHQAFSAIRLAELLVAGRDWFPEFDPEIVHDHGRALFGKSRYEAILEDVYSDPDPETMIRMAALSAFGSSNYYDDPEDKRRTVNNINACLIAYCDRLQIGKRLPVYDPVNRFIGVELPFDMVIERDGIPWVRFVGRIDGLSYASKDRRNEFRLDENKTASRLGDAWAMSFEMSSQISGYMVAATTMLRHHGLILPNEKGVSKGFVYGLSIPLPKYAYEHTGIVNVDVARTNEQLSEWLDYLIYTHGVWETYKDDPLNAPKFSHSCNRYFRPCSFIPICASPKEERLAYWDALVDDEWSPLKEEHTE